MRVEQDLKNAVKLCWWSPGMNKKIWDDVDGLLT